MSTNSQSVAIPAKELRIRNHINMIVAEGVTHFYPIDYIRPFNQEGKLVVEIHRTPFEFKPDQLVQVRVSSLFRDQRQKITGITAIRRVEEKRQEGKVLRTYKADGRKDGEGELTLRRDAKLKVFEIVSWPAWLPRLDASIRHGIEFCKSWQTVERVMSSFTGGLVISGTARYAEEAAYANDPRRLMGHAEIATKKENRNHEREEEALQV